MRSDFSLWFDNERQNPTMCLFSFFLKIVNSQKIKELQTTILSRYEINGRKLPWRATQDPYAIHISEVMSQQTQVDRVIPYREKRMRDIPDYQTLAQLPKSELLKYWSGLGFNSRALRLQTCAQEVMNRYHGNLPQRRDQLLELPGIWPYTASAICAFAWNLPEPVIDTNIRRVLIFLLKLDENISLQELEKKAKMLIPEGRSRDRHNALMDYGATHLTARKTKIKSLWKQSKFEGSDREVRGWILKQLTGNIAVCLSERNENLQKRVLSLRIVKEHFPHKAVETIVQGMQAEQLLLWKGEMLWIE